MKKEERRPFLLAFIAGCVGVLIGLSLIPTGHKLSLMGDFGSVWLAFPLYKSFGLWAWVLPLVLIRFSIGRLRGEAFVEPGLKILGLLLAVPSLCAVTHALFPGYQMFSPAQMREEVEWGGKLGQWVGNPMEAVLTRFGTVVVCLMVLVLAAWFLEKEELLVRAGKGVLDGMARGMHWFWENGIDAFVGLHERALQALSNWKNRSREKQVAEEARRKLQTPAESIRPLRREETPDPKPLPAPPPAPTAPMRLSSPLKPPSRVNAFFTGEGTAEPPAPIGPTSAKTTPEMEEDVVSAALAESKGPDPLSGSTGSPLSRKQKMEAANIQMAEEEEEDEEEKEEEAPPKPRVVIRNWQLPSPHLLKSAEEPRDLPVDDFEGISRVLKETLTNFGVEVNVVGVNPGPIVTQYEVQPAAGVKITRIVSLADDLALALKCGQVRVVAPIPGKATVGIEVPNSKGQVVTLKELISQEHFLESPKKLLVALGKDIAGDVVLSPVKELPHVLIAGSTGSGKSVCVNTFIASFLFKHKPEEVRLVLVDPKRVEMAIYNGLPHLARPVVNDARKAHLVLKRLVQEMEDRYETLAHAGARDIDSYNAKMHQKREAGDADAFPMHYIVVLVDELADLMMASKDQVEDSITRLAQMARAVGIHLVLATQRPSVEVITGIIKANFPSRIAFQVFSKVDSRTVLDMNGAEALLGRGDMLYLPSGAPKPLRLQGAYVTLEEIERLVDFWKSQGEPYYLWEDLDESKSSSASAQGEPEDDLYDEAVEIVFRAKQASTSLLQRRLKIGYGRAARLLDDMEVRGLIGPADGNKPRKILVPNEGDTDSPEDEDEEFTDEKP